jgi:hypothetical protein
VVRHSPRMTRTLSPLASDRRPVGQRRSRLRSPDMAHDFSTVNTMAGHASAHVTSARTAAGYIHDENTRTAVNELVEAVGGAVDAINFLVEALSRG